MHRIGVAVCSGVVVLGIIVSGAVYGETAVTPGAAPVAAGNEPAPAGPAPKLRCDQPTYDAGEIWSGAKIEHTFVLANDGDAPLEIIAVQPTCGCTVAGKYDKKIEPGKEGKIPFVVTTARMKGSISKPISIQTNDPRTPRLTLTIKATVKVRISVEPMMGASFVNWTPAMPGTKTVKLTNMTEQPFKLVYEPETQPAASGGLSGFDIKLEEVDPGKVAELTVSLKKPVKEGWQGGQVRIKTGIPEEPDLLVPVSASVQPAVQVIPAMLTGQSTPGQQYRQNVTIRYNRETGMKITGVKTSDPGITAQLTETQPGRLYSLAVIFAADYQTPLDKPASIELTTNLEDRPSINIPCRIRRMAVAPTQPANPADLMVGKTAPAVTLKAPDGSDVKLGGAADQVNVIEFWATWCPYCRRQLPLLQTFSEKFAGKPVRFLVVSTDGQRRVPKPVGPGEIQDTMNQLNVKIPLALDPAGEASPKYGATSLPTLFVVSKNGDIEAVHRGAQMNFTTLETQLNLLLAGKTHADFPKTVSPAASPPLRTAAPPPPTPGPSLKLDGTRLTTGVHKPGEIVRYYVNYRNQGTEPLTISVKGSEGLKIDPEYLKTVRAGEASIIRCEFVAPRKAGAFSHELIFETNDPAHKTERVVLASTAQGLFEIIPPTGVIFPRNPKTQLIPALATLIYNGEGNVEYASAESTSPKFEAKIERLGDSRQARLTVTAKPPFSPGENTAVVRVATNNKEQPTLEVPVRLFSPPRIEMDPPKASVLASSQLQRAVVTIRNNGEKPVSILGIKPSDERIKYQFYPELDGMSYKLMISVNLADGSKLSDAKLTIRTDDPEYGELVLPVTMIEPPQ